MKKSSKHKNKNKKSLKKAKQLRQQVAPSQPDEQLTPPADGAEGAAPDAEVTPESLVTPESEVAPALTSGSKPALVAKQKAVLLAQQQKAKQANQWNKQVKAGKMVGAHVPKRFNRGG